MLVGASGDRLCSDHALQAKDDAGFWLRSKYCFHSRKEQTSCCEMFGEQ
jgi:hypothetical protein